MALFRIFRRNIGTEEVKHFLKSGEDGFEKVLQKVKIIKAGNGSCVAELKIEKEHTNLLNGLHGGLSATLVDCISSYALLTHEMIPSVSVNIHISYIKGAKIGDEIIIDAHTIKAGKTLAYLKCELRDKKTRNILAEASHTKYIMREKN